MKMLGKINKKILDYVDYVKVGDKEYRRNYQWQWQDNEGNNTTSNAIYKELVKAKKEGRILDYSRASIICYKDFAEYFEALKGKR